MTDTNNDGFDYERQYITGPKDVTSWILRVTHRRDVYERLKGTDSLTHLSLSSILCGMEKDGTIQNLEEDSRSRRVHESSYMNRVTTKYVLRRVRKAPTAVYQRVEEAYRSYMLTVCMAVKEGDYRKTVEPFNDLKIWCYKQIGTDASADRVTVYLKWLCKLCQTMLAGNQLDSGESWFPKFFEEKVPIPFDGELRFLRDIYREGKMTRALTIREFDTLAQMGNGTRALPYASHAQAKESIQKTIDVIATSKRISESDREAYRQGLRMTKERLGKVEFKTHVSLSNSGCLEFSRADGGKQAYLISQVKLLNVPIAECKQYVGKIDHLRSVLIDPVVYDYFLTKRPETSALQVFFLEQENMFSHLERVKEQGNGAPPFDFGRCILLACSVSLRQHGSFNEIDLNDRIPYFEPDVKPKFKYDGKPIPTKGSTVTEAAMKTRLITTTWAAKAQLEQSLNHVLRQWFSTDPFLRIGFEEPDKLYNLLRSYRAMKRSPQSADVASV